MALLVARPANCESPLRSRLLSVAGLTVPVSLSLFLGFLIGCSTNPQVNPSTSSTTTVPTPTTTPKIPTHLALFPESLTIRAGESWNYVAGIGDVGYPVIAQYPEPVTWSVQEGAAGGTITSEGVYTAPSVPGVYHVVGISQSDLTQTATNAVTVGGGLVLSGDSNAVRSAHTTSLLPSGQLIITGGTSTSLEYPAVTQIVNRADQYDPETAVFRFMANVTRSFHTATVLPNGDLLFLGGYTTIVPSGPNVSPVTPVPAATAEILSPGTGTVRAAGQMSIARADHTATLLPNGKILIAGGYTPSASLPPYSAATSAAELYDPTSGTSSPAGRMSVARVGHVAMLLPNGEVLIIGDGSAELYDPVANVFTPTGSPAPRGNSFTATLLPNGKVLVAGGSILNPQQYPYVPIDTAELYDPATGQFTPIGNLTIARSAHTATLLPNGTVLLAGGFTKPANVGDDLPLLATTEIFDPQTNTFTAGRDMETQREGHTATLLLDGALLFVGGSWNSPAISTEIFH